MFIMHDLCGVRTGNFDSFQRKQTLLGENIPKKFGTFFAVSRFGPFGLYVTTKCSTMNHGMSLRSNTRIWDELIIYAEAAREQAN